MSKGGFGQGTDNLQNQNNGVRSASNNTDRPHQTAKERKGGHGRQSQNGHWKNSDAGWSMEGLDENKNSPLFNDSLASMVE